MGKQSSKRGKSSEPPRFPRLITGRIAAGLEKLLSVPPTFDVQLERAEKSVSTKLIFTFPMPVDFTKSYPKLYYLICGPWASAWEKAIAVGYWKSKYNNKNLHNFIQSVLRRAFAGGVKAYLMEVWNLPDEFYKEQVVEELASFAEHTVSKPGPQPDARLAFWAAKRYDGLLPAIKAIRRKFHGREEKRTEELKNEIEKLCSYEIYVAALRKLCKEARVTPWNICASEPQSKLIALAIIECELPKSGYTIDVKHGSLWKRIQLGRKLIKLLTSPPDLPSPASA